MSMVNVSEVGASQIDVISEAGVFHPIVLRANTPAELCFDGNIDPYAPLATESATLHTRCMTQSVEVIKLWAGKQLKFNNEWVEGQVDVSTVGETKFDIYFNSDMQLMIKIWLPKSVSFARNGITPLAQLLKQLEVLRDKIVEALTSTLETYPGKVALHALMADVTFAL